MQLKNDNDGDNASYDNNRKASVGEKIEVYLLLENLNFQSKESEIRSNGEHLVVLDDGNQ